MRRNLQIMHNLFRIMLAIFANDAQIIFIEYFAKSLKLKVIRNVTLG